MTRIELSATLDRVSEDHRPHFGSSVAMSRMTLLSTRTARGTSTPRELHDLFGRHPGSGAPEKDLVGPFPTRVRGLLLDDLNRVSLDHELLLGLWEKPEALADILRNRPLTFRSDVHAL